MTAVSLRSRVLEVLLSQGPWVQRAALDGLTTCQPALDDVLADLVIEGHAEFKRHVGYRACGGPLVREAHRRLLQDKALVRAVVAAERPCDAGAQLVLGVAERRPELGRPGDVLTYELALPACASPADLLAQAQALAGGMRTGLLAQPGGPSHG